MKNYQKTFNFYCLLMIKKFPDLKPSKGVFREKPKRFRETLPLKAVNQNYSLVLIIISQRQRMALSP